MATVFALRDKWAKGETVFGIFASLPCAFACEVATIKGVDYVCVDQQHGVTDYRDMIEMARAIDARGAVPLTRVPANEDWIIGKNLDAGAQGVIIPMVSNPEQAKKAVAACRYPPKGERSNGPARAAIVMGTRDQKALGDGVLCLPMIETREGLEKVEEIAATPGLDGLYIGPSDLAISLGLGPGLDRDEPEHVAAVEKILKACQKNNIIPGIHTGSPRFAKQFAARGFRLVTFGGDAGLLRTGIERAVTELRG
jgi:4-hydroxy-2-oxoheptanedioate aldolase